MTLQYSETFTELHEALAALRARVDAGWYLDTLAEREDGCGRFRLEMSRDIETEGEE